ncbi:MAG: PIN domain-containing protein [Candidatus Woesearchaeota archaeon]
MKYYVDTCIWRDYWENRSDGLRPLGEFAFQFLKNLNRDDVILVSDVVVDELLKYYDSKTIAEMLTITTQIIRVSISAEEYARAKLMRNAPSIPLGDAMHQIIAEREHAIIVTRDKHFISRRLPEEL